MARHNLLPCITIVCQAGGSGDKKRMGIREDGSNSYVSVVPNAKFSGVIHILDENVTIREA